jgi:tripartite-type tricarboxylate transporter receptor subunit TctC
MRDPGYDWRRDLVPVAGLASVPLILVTPPQLAASDARSFAALLKRRADGLSYASAGIGNTTHLAALRLLQDLGAKAVHVPYPGDGPALADLLRGTTDFYLATINTALPFVREGKLKGLAVSSPDRASSAPDIPTLAETVSSGFEAESWHGLMMPASTPDRIVQRLGEEFLKALDDPETRSRLDQMGVIRRPRPQASYRSYLEDEARKWQEVITTAGVRLD